MKHLPLLAAAALILSGTAAMAQDAEAGAAGLVWDEAALAEYLAAPKTKVPGGKMACAGLKKPDELQSVITSLKSR